MRETRPLKRGIPLAMRYATMATANTQPSQVAQWIKVFVVRCFDPRRIRRKKCLLATFALLVAM